MTQQRETTGYVFVRCVVCWCFSLVASAVRIPIWSSRVEWQIHLCTLLDQVWEVQLGSWPF